MITGAQIRNPLTPVAALPPICTPYSTYYLTTTNIAYICTATNTFTPLSAGGSSSGSTSSGASTAVQGSNGSGGFTDTGCTAAQGTLTCPNGFTSSGPFVATGQHQPASSLTTSANTNSLAFDSANFDHLTRKDSAGTLHDLEFPRTVRIASYTFDGSGAALSGTSDACEDVPFAATITGITLLAYPPGSATVDVLTVPFSGYAGESTANTITSSAIPALVNAVKYQDTTLTGWTTVVAANTVLCFHLTNPSTVTWVMVDVKGTAN